MRYLVLGQGKSGTTALYKAVEQMLPHPVRTFFEPKDLTRLAKTPGTVVAKVLIEHVKDGDIPILDSFDKRIFICRDPRDVTVSRLLYRVRDLGFIYDEHKREEFLGLIRLKESQPKTLPIIEIFEWIASATGLENQLVALEKIHKKAVRLWDALKGEFFLSRYEDFVSGNNGDLGRYLGNSVSSNVEVGSAYQRVARRGSSGDWKHWFTSKDVETIGPMFLDYMNAFGYTDWEQPDIQSIEPDHASRYVERIVAEKLAS